MRGRKPRAVVSSCLCGGAWSQGEPSWKELPRPPEQGAHPEVNKEVGEAQGTQN